MPYSGWKDPLYWKVRAKAKEQLGILRGWGAPFEKAIRKCVALVTNQFVEPIARAVIENGEWPPWIADAISRAWEEGEPLEAIPLEPPPPPAVGPEVAMHDDMEVDPEMPVVFDPSDEAIEDDEEETPQVSPPGIPPEFPPPDFGDELENEGNLPFWKERQTLGNFYITKHREELQAFVRATPRCAEEDAKFRTQWRNLGAHRFYELRTTSAEYIRLVHDYYIAKPRMVPKLRGAKGLFVSGHGMDVLHAPDDLPLGQFEPPPAP